MIDPSFLRKRKRKWKFPLESILFHIFVVCAIFFVSRLQDERKAEEEKAKQVEEQKKILNVTPITEEEFRRMLPKEVVDTQFVNPTKEKPKDQAKYFAEKTQRVQKETRAKNFGKANAGQAGKTSETTKGSTAKNQPVKNESNAPPEPGFGSKPTIGRNLELGEKSLLQKGNYNALDSDVAVGASTILNTDEYIYASFYNRMRESIANYWEPRIRQILESNYNKLKAGVYKTDVRIFISREGEVLEVALLSSSSVKDLDTIAVSSVYEAHIFHNPPPMLFDKDPRAGIEFAFLIDISAGNLMNFNYQPDDRLRTP